MRTICFRRGSETGSTVAESTSTILGSGRGGPEETIGRTGGTTTTNGRGGSGRIPRRRPTRYLRSGARSASVMGRFVDSRRLV